MAEPARRERYAVLDSWWGDAGCERAYVSRTLAGALACHGRVDILVPEAAGPPRPDGAFDVMSVGRDPDSTSGWPRAAGAALPRVAYDAVVVVSTADDGALALARQLEASALLVVRTEAQEHGAGTAPRDDPDGPGILSVGTTASPGGGERAVGFYVTCDVEARSEPLNGVGCSDYLLVLQGRPDSPDHGASGHRRPTGSEPAAARWLMARFPRHHVVTVADGVVTVWRHRSPHGSLRIGSRMDLWRLMAFARVTIDPLPGDVIARECVESLLLGVPIVTPARGVAAVHASVGGATYRDASGLLSAVESLLDPARRRLLSSAGQTYAHGGFASPTTFVERVGEAVGAFGGRQTTTR